uniref:SAND domain-containing protein n=1 Tax=Pristionchus pacificus TaxID=54126 RepID=A0A2A6C5L6_PRIPA|eukprot:PDM73397.1 hypothetical protein PRIPAC_40753 [Pristionchus pacificus]
MVDSGLPLVVTPDPSSASPSSTGSLTTVACLGGGPTTTITISRSASPSSSQDDSPLLLLTTVDEASIDARAAQQASLGPIIGVPNGPKIIEVKCGPLHAKMHVEHFLCPGIHQPCIELDVYRPCKQGQAKGLEGQHQNWQEQSEISNGDAFVRLLQPLAVLLGQVPEPELHYAQERAPAQQQREGLRLVVLLDHLGERQGQFVHLQQALNNNNNNPVKEEIIDVTSPPEVQLPTTDQITGMMRSQPSLFWSQLAHTALLDDVIDLVQQEVDVMRATAKHAGPASPPGKAADSLCRVALSLQLGEQIAARVRTRHFHQAAVHEMERKRRLEASSFPTTLGEAIKRPCLQYEPAPLIKLEPKQNEFVPSSNSAFSMPTPSHHVELLLKLTEALLKIQANQATATVQ